MLQQGLEFILLSVVWGLSSNRCWCENVISGRKKVLSVFLLEYVFRRFIQNFFKFWLKTIFLPLNEIRLVLAVAFVFVVFFIDLRGDLVSKCYVLLEWIYSFVDLNSFAEGLYHSSCTFMNVWISKGFQHFLLISQFIESFCCQPIEFFVRLQRLCIFPNLCWKKEKIIRSFYISKN